MWPNISEPLLQRKTHVHNTRVRQITQSVLSTNLCFCRPSSTYRRIGLETSYTWNGKWAQVRIGCVNCLDALLDALWRFTTETTLSVVFLNGYFWISKFDSQLMDWETESTSQIILQWSHANHHLPQDCFEHIPPFSMVHQHSRLTRPSGGRPIDPASCELWGCRFSNCALDPKPGTGSLSYWTCKIAK